MDEAALHRRPLLIYGAGTTGKLVFRVLSEAGYVVDAFLDAAAKPNASWQGIPVYHPNDPCLSNEQRGRAHVVLCVFNAFAELAPIVGNLRQLGFKSITTYLDFHPSFARELGDCYWLTSRSFYAAQRQQCQAANELWSDETSRTLYLAILRLRLLGDHAVLPVPDTKDQYFPADLPGYRQPLRFIDCGAYHGDTLEQVLAHGLALAAVAAFEPDDGNFVALSRYAVAHRDTLPKDVFLFPCGVDGTARKVRFSSGQGYSSRLDSAGDTLIQCAAIDEALPGFAPTFIKMDIEGAELGALWGARRTIIEHQPALAISLYHQPAHLWQLPLLVANWYGNRATYHLRSHGCNGFELVLYVRPT